jgi:tetratricopeptide (TPR) repeat protein
MNERLSRKEIKRDPLAENVGRSLEYVSDHLRTILLVFGGIAAVAVVAVAVATYLGERRERAQEALDHALAVYGAPVGVPEPRPEDPEAPSFTDDGARRAAARVAFEGLAESHGKAPAGRVARLFLARMEAEDGNPERALELWRRSLEAEPGDLLGIEARVNVLAALRERGEGEAVVGELEPLLAQPSAPLPKDLLLFELAQGYEDLGRSEEAASTYQRVVEEFPNSPYAIEARERSGGLSAQQQAPLPEPF